MNRTTVFPLRAVRAVALHAQGLSAPDAPGEVTGDAIYEAIARIGCVQIDTLQVVRRSQYVALWSRVGNYDPAELDRLAYEAGERRLFEYWFHAACLIPLTTYRYMIARMHHHGNREDAWHAQWLAQEDSAAIIQGVMDRVRQEGGLRAADFEHKSKEGGSWWDWKPAKLALERLYNWGELMIEDRANFQRVYNLRERVLPEWVDTSEPGPEETMRHLLALSARALGVCQAGQVADYTHTKRTVARPVTEALLAEGVLVEVKARLGDGEAHDLIVHKDNVRLLEQAADGALPAERTTFLSPFDNLFWAQGRDAQFWGFRQVLEAYKPAKQREWGYFCLPILHGERLVGRFDPKLERKTGTLRLKALYLEPGVDPDEELVSAVAGAMGDFMAFHEASTLAIEGSDPAGFGAKLEKRIGRG